jgi:hypothetical protein
LDESITLVTYSESQSSRFFTGLCDLDSPVDRLHRLEHALPPIVSTSSLLRTPQEVTMRAIVLLTMTLVLQTTAGELAEAQSRSVFVNSVRLSDATVQALEQKYRIALRDGDYWYDKMSGAWGMHGGPTVGFTLAGLDLGGPLKADASAGNTGVFVNGRQLHQYDVLALMQLTPVYQGRFWMDAMGNVGVEGQPAVINLWVLASQRNGRGGGASTSYTRSGGMFGSDGNGCLVFNDGAGTSATSGC